LREAQAELELERGRQKVAKREWEIFGREVDPSLASGELALRKPQLAQAEADVKSANAAVQEAKLNLERTAIRAPFDSIVLDEDAEIGQRVGPEMTIARIVGTDSFWINASVPFESYQLITPVNGDKGAPVTVYLDTGLDGDIEDPLSLNNIQEQNSIPLESYVRVEISAGDLQNVYKIPRQGIRENNSVWVVGDDNRLAIKEVKIVWRYKDNIYVTDGFTEGERLIISHLASVIPGMEVVVRDGTEGTKNIASSVTTSICE
jgi:multidrug efflux pump subunit AcrA (membrane-fusion protein)